MVNNLLNKSEHHLVIVRMSDIKMYKDLGKRYSISEAFIELDCLPFPNSDYSLCVLVGGNTFHKIDRKGNVAKRRLTG